jgi:hypothetical protein
MAIDIEKDHYQSKAEINFDLRQVRKAHLAYDHSLKHTGTGNVIYRLSQLKNPRPVRRFVAGVLKSSQEF